MKQTAFAKNLEFIRTSLGYSQKAFCGKVGNNSKAVLSISENTYLNYLKNCTTPTLNNQNIILEEINAAIEKHPVLSKRFPKGIINNELMEGDLEELSKCVLTETASRYPEKILGLYYCYYMSTNIDGDKVLNYGLLQIAKAEDKSEYFARGLFTIESFDILFEAFKKIQRGMELDRVFADSAERIVSGEASVSADVIWISVSSENGNENISMSFDLSPKILTKNPNKEFLGSRGIALSQSVGQKNKSTAFPIVITKKPVRESNAVLNKYLHFSYSYIDESEIDALAENSVKLLEDMQKMDSFNEQLMRSVVSINVKNGIKKILSSNVFNSHYYLSKEMEDFYREIIKPLRQNPENE